MVGLGLAGTSAGLVSRRDSKLVFAKVSPEGLIIFNRKCGLRRHKDGFTADMTRNSTQYLKVLSGMVAALVVPFSLFYLLRDGTGA